MTQYAYHAAGWKTNEVIVGMATNKFSYDPAGNLRTLHDGKDQLTSWGYDPYGRMASKTNDNNVVMLAYLYDANGRLTNRWSAAKGSTGYAYDAAGNLTNINYPSSTDIQYAYDALDRMSTMVDASGTTTWTYDLTNRYLVEDGPWASDNVTNRWNTAGQRESLAIQQPHAGSYFNTAYAYDAASRLTNITSGAGAYSYYYHPGLNSTKTASRLIMGLFLPNTSFIDNYHDQAGRLTGTYLTKSDGTTWLNFHAYLYNNANQRTLQMFTDYGWHDYLYDNAGQLYSAKAYANGGASIPAQNRGYAYDPAWNMTQRTNNTTPTSYAPNNLNQITTDGYMNATFDGNGNLVDRGSGYITYGYDDENQLSRITSSTSYRTEFFYDGKMRLRRIKEYTWLSPYGWYPGAETRYVYDGMLVVQERNSANTPAVTYTRGTDLSGTLEGAGGIGGLLGRSHGYSTATGAWGTHNHYHADGNGNITYLVNASQGLAASYKYDPFGRILGSSGTLASANLYRFSSKMVHPNSGFYYYGYRFYNPDLQRWMNRDPLGEHGGVNLYAYVNNDPIREIDPLGLLPPSSPVCQALLRKINNITKDIQKRTRELYEDPLKLPGKLPGDKEKPSTTRRGHQMMINRDKARLAKHKANYQATCSDPEPPSAPSGCPVPILAGGPVNPKQGLVTIGGAIIIIAAPEAAPILVPALP